jgi:hypothetical protein
MVTTTLRATRASDVLAGPRGRRWTWPAAFTLAGLVLFTVYLRQARMVPVNSDGASNALQAWDMLHGNLLLHGWTLTDVSFYTVDVPEYMLVELVHGLNPGTADIAAALSYTLMVIGTAVLARGSARGREGVVRALIGAGIVLAPPSGRTTATLISDPNHLTTQVPLLVVWIILDRVRPRWWVPGVVTVLLAWTQVADPLATYEGALPLAVVCAIHLYGRRGEASWLRDSWYALSLAAGAVVSAGLAELAMRLIRQAGGFAVTPVENTFTPVAGLYSHVWVTIDNVLVVFGADFSGQQPGVGAGIAIVHLAGVALAGWAAASALRHFTSTELVVRILVVTIVVLLVADTVIGDNALGGPHEIAGVLPAGAALAGRLLAGRLIGGRHLPLLAALLACNLAICAYNVGQRPEPDRNRQLAAWLRARDLRYGLATYWDASSVTLDSGDLVRVRPVNRNPAGVITAVDRESLPSWFDQRVHDARFLVLPGRGQGCVNGGRHAWLASVRASFGPPAASYRVAGMLVLVWPGNLLDHLRRDGAPGVC